jgi:poly-gamma-glutamate capsule biosynthesis protein CapA/YwtB (metallophosphatase superfamily)
VRARWVLPFAMCCLSLALFSQEKRPDAAVTLLAFGDVNLGRAVGQRLLKGELEFPFVHVRDSLRKAQVVIVNLESQLTDQGGVTQDPKDNLVFCGPPVGGRSLREANITVVSTANNHAYDYSLNGVRETIANLDSAGVAFSGTSSDSTGLFSPAIIDLGVLRVGFVAYTQFVNGKRGWAGHISIFDERRARQEIDELRRHVDLVVASFHGGSEYVDEPGRTTLRQMRSLINAGADIVIGHHPHYAQGIEQYRGKLIFYSLGNFVFYQPQREWAQRGLGVEIRIGMSEGKATVQRVRLLPLRAGLQPSFSMTHAEQVTMMDRVAEFSNVHIGEVDGLWLVQTHDDTK